MRYRKPVVQLIYKSFYTILTCADIKDLDEQALLYMCHLQKPELQACRVPISVLGYCMLMLLPHANARASSMQSPYLCP